MGRSEPVLFNRHCIGERFVSRAASKLLQGLRLDAMMMVSESRDPGQGDSGDNANPKPLVV
jgi:hypothetical protein